MKLCNREIDITQEELFKLVQRDLGFRGRAKIIEWDTYDNDAWHEDIKEFRTDDYACYGFVSNSGIHSDYYGTWYYSHSKMLELLKKNGYIN